MKLLAKCLLIILMIIDFSQSQNEPINLDVDSECSIPNQSKTKGICVDRKNCLEYETLFNVTDLTVERLSFIMNLNCGFDQSLWKTLVCCPQPGNYYKYVNHFDLVIARSRKQFIGAHNEKFKEEIKTVELAVR